MEEKPRLRIRELVHFDGDEVRAVWTRHFTYFLLLCQVFVPQGRARLFEQTSRFLLILDMDETLQGHVFQVVGSHGLGLLIFFFFEIFDALQPVLQADAQVRELAHPDGVLP